MLAHRDSPNAISIKIVYQPKQAMSTINVDFITPAQSRAGRALLDITQAELADAANLGLSTVVDFERQRRRVSRGAVAAIGHALGRAGVEFIDENGGGQGVRLRRRQQKKG
jgi:transcriptional regulator with XRE-family HTH domain